MNWKKTSFYHLLPDEKEDLNEENLKEFFRTMYERQQIWYKRFILKQKQPWTEDQILANSKFTNVYRELDRTSAFLIQNVISDSRLSLSDIVFAVMLFRVINNDEFFKTTGYKIPKAHEYNESKLLKDLLKFKKSGTEVLNQKAYKINTYFRAGMDRITAYVEDIITPCWNITDTIVSHLTDFTKTDVEIAETIVAQIRNIPPIGGFLSHEFFVDFCYINKYGFYKVNVNENSYTNVGPGASVGLRLIFPSLKNQKEGIYLLKRLSKNQLSNFEEDFKYISWNKKSRTYICPDIFNPKITLHQIEMWLCEYQKYWKMKVGEGKQRSKFIPKTK